MFARLAEASLSLDIGTLFVIAICVTSLLGLFLLFAWVQDRISALAWWGAAYLIGAISGVIWRLGDAISPPLPASIPDILLFIAVGMIWSAARLFHGRQVLWGSMCLGAVVWLASSSVPAFAGSAGSRLVLSSVIVATYTFLIAAELWRERRKSVIRQWPAILVPMLHGVIFLFPVALAGLSQPGGGVLSLGTGWVAVYAIEVVLYVVGAAFIVLVLAKDRTVRQYKLAAATDPLTELLNRRGFFEACAEMMSNRRLTKQPVSVLAFDLDHFKKINDTHGHHTGDATLHLFASVVKKTLRASDVIGRLGGEEFIALLPSTLAEAGDRRRTRAAGLRVGKRIAGRSRHGNREHRCRVRIAVGRDRYADRPRRCRALSRQEQRPQPHRGRRRSGRRSAGGPRHSTQRIEPKQSRIAAAISDFSSESGGATARIAAGR